jgi:hypothetical protein
MTDICAKFDPNADIAGCMSRMFSSLYSQGIESAHATFSQVDEIRAGKRPEPPADQLTPQLRMLLYFSQGTKTFEAELAQTFGAEEAHKIAYSNDLCFNAHTAH